MTEEKKQAGAKERSQAILEEQRRLRKEKFLSNPALIIGLVGMVIIVLAALVLPAVSSVDPNEMKVLDRNHRGQNIFSVLMNSEGTCLSALCTERGSPFALGEL